MSGLVACGSLASCLNSGLVSIACGGGYGDRGFSSLPQPTVTAEVLWTSATPTRRTVAGLVLDDGWYWVFYSARDNPPVLAGLVQGTGTITLRLLRFHEHQGLQFGRRWNSLRDDEWHL